jgi:hypothetical protein
LSLFDLFFYFIRFSFQFFFCSLTGYNMECCNYIFSFLLFLFHGYFEDVLSLSLAIPQVSVATQ